MPASTQITLCDYLQTSFRPDREFVDGEVRERNVGKWEHARVQALLAAWFSNHETEWGILVSTEQRVQVSGTRVRIPDLVVLLAGSQPDILIDPPLLVIEILSPDDIYSDTQQRAQDYREMGVQTIWIIDPKTRTGRVCHDGDWTETRQPRVPGTEIFVELDAVFAKINSRQV